MGEIADYADILMGRGACQGEEKGERGCAGRAVPRRLDVVFECWPDVILYCEIYVSITALRQRNVSKMKVAIFQLNSLIVNEAPPIHNPPSII